MGKELKVDPAAMNAAAAAFRGLPATLDGPQRDFYPVVLSIGDFEPGKNLKTVIETGAKDWETVLATLSNVFVDCDGVLVSAATLLQDSDESNDPFVLDDINSIVG